MEDNTQPVVDTAPVQETNSILNTEEALGYDDYVNENAVRIEQSDEVDSLNLATAVVVALYYLK